MLTIERLRAMPPDDRAAYLRGVHAGIDSNDRKAREYRERAAACDAMIAEIKAYQATLEAAGLWPVAAPATTALRGELLMSGQTEAIDALDRLAKGGER